MIPNLRATRALVIFLLLTIPLIPVQFVLRALNLRASHRLPCWYHRQVCRIVGVDVHVEGELARDHAVLVVSNHLSWMDIPLLSTLGPLSFVAKQEVSTWPFVRTLARLQRTIFVDRERRSTLPRTAAEIAGRLSDGDHVVLFAEGTSGDGNRILPFKSPLFVAAEAAESVSDTDAPIRIQTIALAYTHRHGLHLGRRERPQVAWYGDMDLLPHAWEFLRGGPYRAAIRIGEPVAMAEIGGRKELARFTEARVRQDFARIVRQPRDHDIADSIDSATGARQAAPVQTSVLDELGRPA